MVTRLSRGILRELVKTSPNDQHYMHSLNNKTWRHIKNTLRDTSCSSYTISDLQCYLYYLKGSREHREVLSRYQGKGERSIEESANLVGLTLPPSEEQRQRQDGETITETNEQMQTT